MQKIIYEGNSIQTKNNDKNFRAFSLKELFHKYGSAGFSKNASSGAGESEETSLSPKKFIQTKNLKSSSGNLSSMNKREKATEKAKGLAKNPPVTRTTPIKINEFVQEIEMAHRYCRIALPSFALQSLEASHNFEEITSQAPKGNIPTSIGRIGTRTHSLPIIKTLNQNLQTKNSQMRNFNNLDSHGRSKQHLNSSNNQNNQTSFANTTLGRSQILGKISNEIGSDQIRSPGGIGGEINKSSGVGSYFKFKRQQMEMKNFREFLEWEKEESENDQIESRNKMVSLFCISHDTKIYGKTPAKLNHSPQFFSPKISSRKSNASEEKLGTMTVLNNLGHENLLPSQTSRMPIEDRKSQFEFDLKATPFNTPKANGKSQEDASEDGKKEKKIPNDFLFLETGFPTVHASSPIKKFLAPKDTQRQIAFWHSAQKAKELKNEKISKMFEDFPEEEEPNTSREIIESISPSQFDQFKSVRKSSIAWKYKNFKKELREKTEEMAKSHQETLKQLKETASFSRKTSSKMIQSINSAQENPALTSRISNRNLRLSLFQWAKPNIIEKTNSWPQEQFLAT